MLEDTYMAAIVVTLITSLAIIPAGLVWRYARTPQTRWKPLGYVLLAIGLEGPSIALLLMGANELGLIAVDQAWRRGIVTVLLGIGIPAFLVAIAILPDWQRGHAERRPEHGESL